MRVSTKLGIGGLLAAGVLGVVAAGLTPAAEAAPDPLSFVDSVLRLEAAGSLQLLSNAALATGLLAMIVSACASLRRTPYPSSGSAALAPGPAGAWGAISLRTECFLVLGIVALLFAINFATAELYPLVWLDETGYTDPGINLARGNGLTSSIWGHVYWGKFWFSYPPLYPLLVAGWVKLWGVNLTYIRSLNLVLISGTAIALWYYTIRSRLFPSMLGRITLVLLPLLGYYVSFTYRSARVDALCALLAALALDASTIPDRRRRTVALVVVGSLAPWAGLQLGAFAVILAVLIGVWWPRQAIAVFLPLGCGIGLGLIALLGFYAANHSLYGFLASTFGSFHTITGQIAQQVVMNDPRSPRHFARLPALLLAVVFEDRSSAFLAMAGILLLLALRRATDTAAFRAARFAVIAAFGVPVLMEIAGQYWFQYTWMGLLAVGVSVVAGLHTTPASATSSALRRLAIGGVGLALVIGLPLQLARAYAQRDARDYDAVRAYVRSLTAPGDWVFSSPEPYFALAELGAVPVSVGYASGHLAPSIPEDQRQRIGLFIVHPDEVNGAIERLGGSWETAGPSFNPPAASRLALGEGGGRDNAYQLVAYRRADRASVQPANPGNAPSTK